MCVCGCWRYGSRACMYWMYVCKYVCMPTVAVKRCTYRIIMHACISIFARYARKCTFKWICMHVGRCVCMHVFLPLLDMRASVHSSECVCMHVGLRMYVCIYVCMGARYCAGYRVLKLIFFMYVCMYVCIFLWHSQGNRVFEWWFFIHLCMYVYMYVWCLLGMGNIHREIVMYVCMYGFMYVCMYVWMSVWHVSCLFCMLSFAKGPCMYVCVYT